MADDERRDEGRGGGRDEGGDKGRRDEGPDEGRLDGRDPDGDVEPDSNAELDGDAEVDPGEPIESLRDLALATRPGFFSRVRGRVDRRLLWSDIATFSWSGFAEAMLEYLTVLFGLLRGGGGNDDKGGGDGADQS